MADDTATMDDVLAEFRENGWNAGIVKNDAGIECLIIDGKPLGSMDWVSKHPRRLMKTCRWVARRRDEFDGVLREDDDQADWDAFIDDLWQTADDMGLEGLADWFVELNDPTTIKARYWIHDGIEYLDAAHTMPRDEM